MISRLISMLVKELKRDRMERAASGGGINNPRVKSQSTDEKKASGKHQEIVYSQRQLPKSIDLKTTHLEGSWLRLSSSQLSINSP